MRILKSHASARWFGILGVLAVGLGACDDAADPVSAETETQQAAMVAPGAPTLTAEQVMVDDMLRRQMVYPETTVVTPDLTQDPGIPLASPAVLDAITVPDDFVAPVPVLVPDGYGDLTTAFWSDTPHTYAVSLGERDGVRVFVRGNRAFQERPALRQELEAAGYDPAGPHLAVSHGVWTVQFMAYGVSYTLDVECSTGPVDERCQSEGYPLEIYDHLVRVEGM